MLISEFDFELPPDLIAQKPLPKRDASRMMVVNRTTKEISHSSFAQFSNFLEKGNILVLNESRVIPARIWGKAKNKEIEFLFIKELKNNIWEVLCRPAKKLKLSDTIRFTSEHEAVVVQVGPEGRRHIQFFSTNVRNLLQTIGFAPLPPYIKRKAQPIELRTADLERYQTVFAQKGNSVAAPTAGLHFTLDTLERIEHKNITTVRIALDVGLATFLPLRTEKIEEHKMLKEFYSITPQAAKRINQAKSESQAIIAVGTTSVRTLESAFQEGKVRPGRRSTNLFIYPGYEFQVVNKLLTNFHLPRSTLLLLVNAFGGKDLMKRAYREAVKCRYRFYSYGDCMLIL